MIARAGSGWQTVLADLSLILFMVTAAALQQAEERAPTAPVLPAAPALADPVALWRAAPGGPDLAAWLAAQPTDPRLRLTIVAHHAGDPVAAARAAAMLAARAGRPARIVLEPGAAQPLSAGLTFDAGAGLAHGLQERGH
mgnify:CR=1 FL=1